MRSIQNPVENLLKFICAFNLHIVNRTDITFGN